MIAIGVSEKEFWTLNPRKVKVIADGYRLKRQVNDEEMWMLGGYVFDAVSLAVSNAFRKKSQKAQMYFDVVKEPMTKQIEKNLSEEDKKQKTELLFKNLEIMAANYRLSQGK